MRERRYDIDWLRVIAMLVVFVFHCSRFFCTQGWHLKVAPAEQSELLEIVRDTFGKQNVTSIAAIHHALRHIYPDTSDIGLFVQIGDLVNRATVDSHAHLEFRMTLKRLADFQRAENRRFQAVAKHEGAAVTGRQAQKSAFRFRLLELFGAAHDLAQRLDLIALFCD